MASRTARPGLQVLELDVEERVADRPDPERLEGGEDLGSQFRFDVRRVVVKCDRQADRGRGFDRGGCSPVGQRRDQVIGIVARDAIAAEPEHEDKPMGLRGPNARRQVAIGLRRD